MKAEECVSGKQFVISGSQIIQMKHRGRCSEFVLIRSPLVDSFNAPNNSTMSGKDNKTKNITLFTGCVQIGH